MDVGGTDAPLDVNLMPFITEIAPNETELLSVAGLADKINDEFNKDLLRKAVSVLKEKFATAGNSSIEILVTLGSQGSAHFGANWTNDGKEDILGLLPHETQVGSFKLESADSKPVDTTGAGDCFRGSYVAARYGQNKEIDEAMKWASAAGSLSVEIQGAMPSMPKRSAISRRVTKGSSGGYFATDAVEMKVTLKKPKNFYAQSAISFLKGVEASETREAKPAINALRISGLGDACGVAIAAAAQVEEEKAGAIVSIKTAYPSASGRGCAQIVIDIKKA